MKTMRNGGLTAVLGVFLVLAAFGAEAQEESIGVSGFWKLTVSDADGSNAQVFEFSNALTAEGGQLLERVLFELAIPAPLPPGDLCFGITCEDGALCIEGNCTFSCEAVLVDQKEMPAVIRLKPLGQPDSPVELDAVVDTGGVFRASWEADRSIDVAEVSTVLGLVPCPSGGGQLPPAPALTQKSLVTPITVENGQLLNVEVDISFSTANP